MFSYLWRWLRHLNHIHYRADLGMPTGSEPFRSSVMATYRRCLYCNRPFVEFE